MFGARGGVGELNPGAVACPAKDSGGPGLACIRCGCRADNAMGVIRRYLLKPAQVLSDILFLSFSAFRRRAAGRGR